MRIIFVILLSEEIISSKCWQMVRYAIEYQMIRVSIEK